MKKILVLTDFSENAKKAVETAAFFAGKLHAGLLLLNTNDAIPAIPYYPGVLMPVEGVFWQEEREKNMESLVKELKKVVTKLNPYRRKPPVRTLLREGELAANVAKVIGKENIEMIVMGAPSGNSIDHILFGSDISSVIDHSTCPVLIINPSTGISKVDRVMFATDFNEADILVIEYLIKLGELFEYQLEIVHVTLYGDHALPKDNSVKVFIEQLASTQYPNVIFHDIRGKNLLVRLDKICEEREPDILAFVHPKHSIFKRMLKEGNVKKAISHQKLPLFIFPSLSNQKSNPLKKPPGAHKNELH